MGVNTQANEGYSATPYQDSVGVKTVGYGFNMEDPVTRSLLPADVVAGKRAITPQESQAVYNKRMGIAQSDAKDFVGEDIYNGLDQDRQGVLNDMAYNLGGPRLKKFKKFAGALQKGDYDTAANEMQNSNWYKQTGRRATSLTDKMRAGTPQQQLAQAVSEQFE